MVSMTSPVMSSLPTFEEITAADRLSNSSTSSIVEDDSWLPLSIVPNPREQQDAAPVPGVVSQLDVPTQAAPNSDAAAAPALEEPDVKQRPLSSFFGVRKVSKATAAAHNGVDLD